MVTDRLPTASDGDENGDVIGYVTPSLPEPIPWRSVRLNPGNYVGWRKIEQRDYLNPPL